MTTTSAVACPKLVEVESGTRARIDVTETTVGEVRSFIARNDCEVHLERRGGTTQLVVRAD